MSAGSGAWTLCVDFGTAYSKAAAAPGESWARFNPGLVRPLMLGGADASGNAFLLESAVFVDDEHLLFAGEAVARAEALAHRKRAALRSFKTLLSVSDLERALNTAVAASVDPNRQFAMGDLIVLYLAYLLAAIERALMADEDLRDMAFHWRYAAPAWRRGDSAGLHSLIVGLFGEAEALRGVLGAQLLAPEGINIELARRALAAARAAPVRRDMGLIFEATAAAAYSSIGLEQSSSHIIVVDMGAGTTDIAALARGGRRVEELTEARSTLKHAGDFIDTVIANLALEASPWAKSQAQQSALWAAVMPAMRDIKESLFHDGRAALGFDGRTIKLAMADVARAKDFRWFQKTLAEAYDHGLAVVAADARERGRTDIQAIAVGGGASAPFIQELLRRRPKGAGKLRFTERPATPEWAHARIFRGNLAPVFPQLAIAVGGALAPESMLAAQGGGAPN